MNPSICSDTPPPIWEPWQTLFLAEVNERDWQAIDRILVQDFDLSLVDDASQLMKLAPTLESRLL